MSTAYLYDPVYLEHKRDGHVESPDRLEQINSALDQTGMRQRLISIVPKPIGLDQLARVHRAEYIQQVKTIAERGGGELPGRISETYLAPQSFDAALLAAGAVVKAVEAVLRGKVKNAFALVRPPGHHAFPDHGEGFCLFNNIAVAAKTARAEFKIDRVLIIDFDVHHGNGTNSIFYNDPSVLYCSTHQWGIYPGTGHWSEVGAGQGVGYSVNVPLLPGWGDTALNSIFDDLLQPIAYRFQPQLILVSAGYDPHWSDRLGSMLMTGHGFFELMRRLTDWSEELCSGRLVLTLEGGYGLEGLAYGVVASFAAMLGDKAYNDPIGPPPRSVLELDREYLDQLRALHHIEQ